MIEAVTKTAFARNMSIQETLFGRIHDPRDCDAVGILLQAAWITARGPRADSVDHSAEERGALIMSLLQAAQPGRDLAAEFAQQRADYERISEEHAREAESGRPPPVAARPVASSDDLDDGIPF